MNELKAWKIWKDEKWLENTFGCPRVMVKQRGSKIKGLLVVLSNLLECLQKFFGDDF